MSAHGTDGPPADTTAPEAPIVLADVRLAFGRKRVLEGLDLTVEEGTNYVVMGLSGTGKSVTLKTIAGLLRPDSGTVSVTGVRVDRAGRRELAEVRSKMGFLFQNAALIKWMTALENVALPLVESGVPRAEARERARGRLDEVGLGDAADKLPDELSGGMRKRVGFARAVVMDPEIVLYDEPTTGLDPITKRTVDELIVRARDDYGTTGLIVSHDMRSATRVADTIGLLYEGRLVLELPPDEFMRSDHEIARQFARDSGPPSRAVRLPKRRRRDAT
jgi:phospholipid/cholesterol/gamma-HCH transport system ATP-binding protein